MYWIVIDLLPYIRPDRHYNPPLWTSEAILTGSLIPQLKSNYIFGIGCRSRDDWSQKDFENVVEYWLIKKLNKNYIGN